MKKNICLIAQFPPPMHGLSKAVETLYNSDLANKFNFEKVDITDNKKFLKNIFDILKSKSELFYFTISQTKGGNIRDLIIIRLLNLRKKKCVIHLHGGYYRILVEKDMPSWQRKLNYRMIKNVDGAIVLSDKLKSNFEGMISENKIFVVPNCVDNAFLISNEEFEKKLELVKQKKVFQILYLSNFIISKGYREVLRLAKLEKERVLTGESEKFHFNFAGKFFEESEKEFFYNYITENGLGDYITYYGIVDGNQKKELLKKSDIFILLTRYPNEGQPISILEAMGNGMAIVTTDHAGITDVVKDGINGIVLTWDQQKDISSLFEKLNTDSSMLKVNREIILQEYTQEVYIKNLQQIFESLMLGDTDISGN